MKYPFISSIILLLALWQGDNLFAQSKPIPLFFEKAYLHTDRDVYARGDTLWFKAYLLNAQDNTPANSSGNLHVELISPDAKVTSAELIRIESGFGNGDFDLADTLAPGKYRLRAYTNWMRNFGDNYVFEKEITVLSSGGKVAGAVRNKQATVAGATATATLPIIRFYPEGGSLVEGMGSILAVKAEDGFGRGIPASGVVLSAAGDTITNFNCDSLGMGRFTLLPIKGQAYYAAVKFGAKLHNAVFDLPTALSKGYTLQVKQTDSLIRTVVSVSNDPATLATKPVCTISVKHAGITLLNQQLQLSLQQTPVKIPTANFPDGIVAITLYDEQGKPNCERLIYIHHATSIGDISITTDKKTYQPKEKVTVQINTKASANLSMAVVDAAMMPEQVDDIVSYLMLRSEIRGNIEHSHRYFDTTNVNRFKQLDLLLMTQGWRDFVWRRMADTSIRISYAAENGIAVTGNIRDEVNEKRMPNLNLNLYANEAKGNKIFATRTDLSGQFSFTGIMLYGKENIKLSSFNEKGEKKGSFQVDSVFQMPVRKTIVKIIPKADAQDSLLIKGIEIRGEAIKKANLNGITKLKEVTIKDKRENVYLRSGGVMQTWGTGQVFNIIPNDYQYKTLEWYLLQFSKGAQEAVNDYNTLNTPHVRPQTGVTYIGVDTAKFTVPSMGATSGVRYKGKSKPLPPQLVVNGHELDMDHDYDQAEAYRTTYFRMAINKFKKIELKHVVGTLHGLGINSQAESISVDRYLLYLTLIDDAMIDNPGSLSVDVSGYYQARTFYQPPPSAKPQLADYRTTIYWESNIKTEATGKATLSFYNTILQTDAKIIIQGITDNGAPVAAIATYTIR